MTDACSWCGDSGALYGAADRPWRICPGCCEVCAGLNEDRDPGPHHDRMLDQRAEREEINGLMRPAEIPPAPPEILALIDAIAGATNDEQRHALMRELGPLVAGHREVMAARSVCYFCDVSLARDVTGFAGPNVNICGACMDAARASFG